MHQKPKYLIRRKAALGRTMFKAQSRLTGSCWINRLSTYIQVLQQKSPAVAISSGLKPQRSCSVIASYILILFKAMLYLLPSEFLG